MNTILLPTDVERLLISIIADELGQQRGQSIPAEMRLEWNGQTHLTTGAPATDSLELLACAGAVNQFFHLHETGIEDYLLARRTIGEWVQIVLAGLAIRHAQITVRTSGSTGTPKPCTHAVADLVAEAAFWQEMLRPQRIIKLVPCHHIYGLIFTVLLPRLADIPVLDGRVCAPGRLMREMQAGDMLVGFPTILRHLLPTLGMAPAGIGIVTATAPLPDDLARALVASGTTRLVDVYGSSETGGLGWREYPAEHFTLLPHWQATDGQQLQRTGHALPIMPPDHLSWHDARHFCPTARRDRAVQVGGINVFPDHVADTLRCHPLVADAAVRLGGERLKAFVVLKPQAQITIELENELRQWCQQTLRTAECPRSFTFGTSLPRSSIDKNADW